MHIAYQSTRGSAETLSFAEVVTAGLADDGGLYVPETVPAFTPARLAAMQGLPYDALALEIMRPLIGGAMAEEELAALLGETYPSFRHPAVAPLVQLEPNHFLLELFHGPTLAFKDFALQFLGRLLDHLLKNTERQITVIGATSGDTGSAAIAGFAGRGNTQIFILHPKGKVSEVQRRQMTTVADANVHNIAVEGTFDDCQDIVKALFADADWRAHTQLVAVNSINWARILAQVVYYFYAALALGAPARRVSFCVPTGNFGDIFAGYVAKRMGLPVAQLVIATNRNDILARCLATGVYGMEKVTPTLSPSMDIQISSNFERLLFDLHDRDGKAVADMMQRLRRDGKMEITGAALSRLRREFAAGRADDALTRATIAQVYKDCGYLLDPHSAVGVAVARMQPRETSVPMVTIATAHPAKFPDAVQAATGIRPPLPAHMQGLMEKPERCDTLPADLAAVKHYIEKKST